jgi:hypothetical protein
MGEKKRKSYLDMMESNHLHLQSKGNLGGAGNRTQIETGQHEYPRGFPQRHVLPLHHTTDRDGRLHNLLDCGPFSLS